MKRFMLLDIPIINFLYLYETYLYEKVSFCLSWVYKFFSAGDSSFSGFLFWLKIVGGVLSVIFLFGVVLNLVVFARLRKKQLSEMVETLLFDIPEERNLRWEKIKKYFDSDNPSDWKISLLEADNLIDDILKRIGLKGDTLGERLLTLKPYMLESLPDLFRAHLVRNRVVHEADTFELTKEKTREAIDAYEKALKELKYI